MKGFGNAMYAIKDIQNMYQTFDEPKIKQNEIKKTIAPIKSKVQPPKVIPKKEFIKLDQKPKIILKTPIINQSNTKPQSVQIKPNTNINNKTPQNIKKQTTFQTRQTQINCLKVSQNIYELTLNKISTQWDYNIFNQGIKASQIIQNPKINFQFNARTIKQGNIGNCYFICSLAALTQNIDVLKQRIPNYKNYDEKSNKFKVNMFESGKFVEIQVDNAFRNNLSKPVGNDITCLILEKAYAQLYQNYQIMAIGHSIDAMRDLTGHPAQYIDLKDKNNFSKLIIEAFKNNQPMVIASKVTPLNQSISGKHSYNVLSYIEKNKKLYLQLRDPRGWSKASFQIPKDLQNVNQNGQFWINYEDLVSNFEVITVSRYIPNSIYYYKTFCVKALNHDGSGVLSFELKQNVIISFSLHQKHKKFFKNEKYNYSVLNLMICQINEKNQPIKCIKTNFNSQQVCSLNISLKEGKYAFIGQIYPFTINKVHYPQQKLTLSINSPIQLSKFHIIQNFNISKALTLYIQQNKSQFKQLITKQNLYRYHGSLFGKICILYENLSQKQVLQELEFQSQNIEIKQKKFKIMKNQVKLITYSIGPLNNCSHKCTFKSKTFYIK